MYIISLHIEIYTCRYTVSGTWKSEVPFGVVAHTTIYSMHKWPYESFGPFDLYDP